MSARPNPRGAPSRALVVEDDEQVLELVRTILECHGVTVDTATDSQTAQRRVRDQHYDVVILDLILPDCDGVILHGKLRKISPGLEKKTIFMTGFTSNEPVIDYLRSLSVEFIHKPFGPDELVNAVEKVI